MVILSLNLRIRKNLIRLVDLFETFLLPRIRIRMIFFSKGSKGFLNLFRGCFFRDIEDAIVVFIGVVGFDREEPDNSESGEHILSIE